MNLIRLATLATVATLAGCGDGSFDWRAELPRFWISPDPPVPLTQVSDASPFASGCDQQAAVGTVYLSSEVEPSLAVNPVDTGNRVGVWQQNRWSTGGANGILAGVSFDGGATWSSRTAPFSRCTGGAIANGGDYARATDPWISFGPTGTAFWMVMTITDTSTQAISAMRVSRSIDGGDTWEAPITLIHDTSRFFNDKNSITADPTNALYAYAVWDRLDSLDDSGPAFFSRTVDGGVSWEAARAIYDPGTSAQTVGNVIVVLPDGTLLDLFTEIRFGPNPDTATLRLIRSTDQGATWSAPVTIAGMLGVGTYDAESGAPVRSGSIIGAFAVGPGDDVWAAWQDSRFASPGLVVDGIALARSTDGGLTWGDPVLLSPGDVQAFTPAVQVAADGTIGVTYYDFRDDTDADGFLLTDYWLATSADGVLWNEQLISGPFDLSIAPDAFGLFLGDYEGLAVAGNDFVPFFAQTRPSLSNRTNIYTLSLPAAPIVAKAAPVPFRARTAPAPALTPDWSRRIRDNIERSRQHFPDRSTPAYPPAYLR